jgi:hypothetical protein
MGTLATFIFFGLLGCCLVASMHPEGPPTSHLDIGFLGYTSLFKPMLRRFSNSMVVTGCFSYNLPDLNVSN